jgi:hypothetical protein
LGGGVVGSPEARDASEALEIEGSGGGLLR